MVLRRPHQIGGRRLECKKAKPKEVFGDYEGNESGLITKKVFVGGLPDDITEGDLRQTFQDFGDIADIVIIPDKQQLSGRCFGFVQFDSPLSVEEIMRNYYDVRVRNRWVPKSDAGRVQASHRKGKLLQARQRLQPKAAAPRSRNERHRGARARRELRLAARSSGSSSTSTTTSSSTRTCKTKEASPRQSTRRRSLHHTSA